jgi:hypothetical protein
MGAAAHYAALQGLMRAELELERLGAPPSAKRIFREIFARRHQFKRVPEGTRAELAVDMDLSLKQTGRAVVWLKRHAFTFEGNDASGRKLGVVMLRPEWMVREVFHNDDKPRRSSVGNSQPSCNVDKNVPLDTIKTSLVLRTFGEGLYSDPAPIAPSAGTANGNGCHDPTDDEQREREAALRRRRAVGPRDALWSPSQLTRELIGRLRPEDGDDPIDRWNSGHEMSPPAPS